jgi:type I restriction enzyme S subunit
VSVSTQVNIIDLRAGSKMVRFGDVVKNTNLTEHDPEAAGIERIVGLDHLDPENLHVRRWNTLENGTSFSRKFVPGQTLFGKRRAYQRKVAFSEFEGICSSDILTFEPKDPDVLLPELLPFICQTDAFFDHALGTSAGSLSPRTSWKALQDFEFTLPPIEEQKRIAEILWAADEAVERHLHAQELLLSLKNRLFRESLADNSTQLVSCSELFKLPPRNGHSPKTNASGRGSPTLSISAVRDGIVNPNGNTKYAEISSNDLDKFRLEAGDILVVRGNGNRNLCGRAGIVSDVPKDCFYPDLLIRIKFDENKILSAFAVEQWNDPATHSRLLAFAKSTNGIWKVNGKDLKQHKLAVPSLEAQAQIVRRLNDLKNRQDVIVHHIEKAQMLKSMLLNSVIMDKAHV